jgi:hypothetical protein
MDMTKRKQLMFGVCGYGGGDVSNPSDMEQAHYVTNERYNTNQPLTYFKPTKEWLCPHHLKIRKRQKPTEGAIKRDQKEKDLWDSIRNV